MNITIVDYQVGNLGSIKNMLKRIGYQARISSEPDSILEADKLILPGVGSFDSGAKKVHELGLVEPLNEAVVKQGKSILGICVGMQLMLQGSEEGELSGLGWFQGSNKKFNFDEQYQALKVPHMGWNHVLPSQDHPLLQGYSETPRFYFVHSYHADGVEASQRLANTEYGYEFASAIHLGNIYGVQFHPEKSHKWGMQLLKNFVELPTC